MNGPQAAQQGDANMVTLANKYTLIKEATTRFKAVKVDYQVWLDFQVTKGIVFVRPDYVSSLKKETVYCILTRAMSVAEWCKTANKLSGEGYSPILLNSQELI